MFASDKKVRKVSEKKQPSLVFVGKVVGRLLEWKVLHLKGSSWP